jgi:SAM-dependent methyltransferase
MSKLAAAEATWDTMDLDQVRSVAWSSLEQVSGDVWHRFSGAESPAERVNRALAEARFPTPLLTGAALVCGDMESERMWFEHGTHVQFGHVDGFDISAVSMERYHPDGVTFSGHQVDCNRLELAPDRYHLVVASHGAHHVENLGNLFYQANKSLKSGGLLYMYEWIGPEFLQIPRTNHAIASLLLYLLFPREQRVTHMGQQKGRWVQPGPDTFDPSEACNSTDLYPQFLRYFEPLTAVAHAGLTYPIFEGIAQNLDQSDPRTRKRIRLVLRLERLLTRARVIKPLFVVALGRKRDHIF